LGDPSAGETEKNSRPIRKKGSSTGIQKKKFLGRGRGHETRSREPKWPPFKRRETHEKVKKGYFSSEIGETTRGG